jgi:hypothetical protein
MGRSAWQAHRHLGVKLAETQAEWTPLQRLFLQHAADEYGPDNSDVPSPSQLNTPSSSRI